MGDQSVNRAVAVVENTKPKKGSTYDFPNGWSLDVQEIVGDRVRFQRWPPGITKQGFLENLEFISVAQFVAEVEQANGIMRS